MRVKSELSIMAEMFKALGDENRLRLLTALGEGEMFAGELLDKLAVAQPTLSHHMKILCDSGIVESRREGKWIYYKISSEGKREIISYLEKITSGAETLEIPIVPIKIKEKAVKPKKAKPEKGSAVIKEIIEDIKEPEEILLPEAEEEIIVEAPVIEGKEEKKPDRSMPSWLF